MRFLVATGSSGGHIFPATALIDYLKSPDIQMLLVLPLKARENKIPLNCDNVEYIHSSNLTPQLNKRNIINLGFFFLAAWESFRIIIKFKPDVVIGFGSQNTLALIFWAWLFRINTIIHEQNVIPGRANRLLSGIADKIALSFSQTNSYLKGAAGKIKIVGNPIRPELKRIDKKDALDFFDFKEGKINILVTGGSQGSFKLNDIVFRAFDNFKKKDDLQIIHICGSRDFIELKARYVSSGLRYRIFDFLTSMQYAYSAADFVICRAGATTIAELQKFSCPAILVPYPFAYLHQLANARVLEEISAAIVIKDEDLTVEKINAQLLEFSENPSKLKSMQKAYFGQGRPDAAALLAKEVLDFCS
ncbi:MAG: UDP-N-acetylglucosamine--N-acetylmuramyl-(pentapeptide) pyrophosphoryl-undecaprenol N-acetylglucosamine transferase [Candidatus Omnitrophica bacterium]|nr:UDP-N-acetylglucosamine--N-acetylmuramyl-(pentapeptide) pyrophosphoryl-undecaprenol N-acetylglucosamine transferase [Candidatus Omnitrophota bacterium]